MAEIWLVSDHHFFHDNIYKFTQWEGGPRIRREFANEKEGREAMLQYHNETVAPHHHVWNLGDWTLLRAGRDIPLLTEWRKLFNGHHRLLLGNHDHFDVRVYRNLGFEKVQALHKLERLWLSHVPLHPSSLPGWCVANVHGHIHRNPSPVGRYINVSVEVIGYRPIHLDEVLTRASKLMADEIKVDVGGKGMDE